MPAGLAQLGQLLREDTPLSHEIPVSSLRPPGASAVQPLQRRTELNFGWWSRSLLNIPVEPRRRCAHHCGATGHRSELELRAERRIGRGPAQQPATAAWQLDAFKRQLLAVLEQELFGLSQVVERLWQTGAMTRALNAGQLGSREAALLALIEPPQAMEDYVMRARSRSDARRRAERCVAAVE